MANYQKVQNKDNSHCVFGLFGFFSFVEQFPELSQPACEHEISCKTHAYNTTWPKYIIAHLVKSCKRLSILLEMNYIDIPEEASRPLGTGITASSHFPSYLFLWKTREQLFQPATEQPAPRFSEQFGEPPPAARCTAQPGQALWGLGGSRGVRTHSATVRPAKPRSAISCGRLRTGMGFSAYATEKERLKFSSYHLGTRNAVYSLAV